MEKLTLFYNWDQTEEADSIPPRLVEGCQTPPQQNGHIRLPVETHPDDIACQKKSPSEKLTAVSHFGLIWPPSNPSAHLFLVVWAQNDSVLYVWKNRIRNFGHLPKMGLFLDQPRL